MKVFLTALSSKINKKVACYIKINPTYIHNHENRFSLSLAPRNENVKVMEYQLLFNGSCRRSKIFIKNIKNKNRATKIKTLGPFPCCLYNIYIVFAFLISSLLAPHYLV